MLPLAVTAYMSDERVRVSDMYRAYPSIMLILAVVYDIFILLLVRHYCRIIVVVENLCILATKILLRNLHRVFVVVLTQVIAHAQVTSQQTNIYASKMHDCARFIAVLNRYFIWS
jgi:hypothetical protein